MSTETDIAVTRSPSPSPSFNARIKRWPAWIVLAVVVAALVAIGASRPNGPSNNAERVDAIAKRLRCPTCAGETVYESRVASAQNIKEEIARQVAAGTPDAQIKAAIEHTFPDAVLVPDGKGVNALLWTLPVIAAVGGLGALVMVFRRYRDDASRLPEPTDDDRALVDAALRAAHTTADDTHHES